MDPSDNKKIKKFYPYNRTHALSRDWLCSYKKIPCVGSLCNVAAGLSSEDWVYSIPHNLHWHSGIFERWNEPPPATLKSVMNGTSSTTLMSLWLVCLLDLMCPAFMIGCDCLHHHDGISPLKQCTWIKLPSVFVRHSVTVLHDGLYNMLTWMVVC